MSVHRYHVRLGQHVSRRPEAGRRGAAGEGELGVLQPQRFARCPQGTCSHSPLLGAPPQGASFPPGRKTVGRGRVMYIHR